MKITSILAICLSISAASCATKSKNPYSESIVGETYSTIGAENDKLKVCKIKIANITTVVPGPDGQPISVSSVLPTQAVICGWVDCSAMEEEKDSQPQFTCAPIEVIQKQKESK